MRTKSFNKEVLIADEKIVKVRRADLDPLKKSAKANERLRMRLCAHQQNDDKLHEMFIVLAKGVYVRPHKHLRKVESLHVLQGKVDIVFFDDNGAVTDAFSMGDYDSGLVFFYRLTEPVYHTLIVRSDELVFKESTTGPFNREETLFPSWAPEENDKVGAEEFMKKLSKKIPKS